MNPFSPLSAAQRPNFGFRVEGTWWDARKKRESSNITNHQGDMIARATVPTPTSSTSSLNNIEDDFTKDLDAHLSWKPRLTPFISFFSSYQRALKWRYFMVTQKRAHTISILCVWLKDIQDELYDAYAIAEALGYGEDDGGNDNDNRRVLKNHEDEYLVYASLDSENIIASFDGVAIPESVMIRPVLSNSATVVGVRLPRDIFSTPGTAQDVDGEKTRELIQTLKFGGLRDGLDEVKFCVLVLELAGLGPRMERQGDQVVVETRERREQEVIRLVFEWPVRVRYKYWKGEGKKEYQVTLW